MSIDQGLGLGVDKFTLNTPATLNKLQQFIGSSLFGKSKSIESADTKQKTQSQIIPEGKILPVSQPENIFEESDQIQKDSIRTSDAESVPTILVNSKNSINEFTVDPSTAESDEVYMPRITLNQYATRQERLDDIQRLVIKDSKTQILLI